MESVKGIVRKIRQKISKGLEKQLQDESVDYLLRDHFQAFLDLLYKKDIDQYSKVKGLVKDFTDLSSALIQCQQEEILDYIFERVFPAFLFQLIDDSLRQGLIDPIFSLKEQVSKIWEAYHLQQLEELKIANELGYLVPMVSKDSDITDNVSDDSDIDEEGTESKNKSKNESSEK